MSVWLRRSLLAFFLLTACASPEVMRLANTEPVMIVTVREVAYELRAAAPLDGTLDVLVDRSEPGLTTLPVSEQAANAAEAAQEIAAERCAAPTVIHAGPIDTRAVFVSYLVRFACR